MATGHAAKTGGRRCLGWLIAAAVTLLAIAPLPAQATELRKVLVVAETSPGALRLDHPAWARADAAISEQLRDDGFDVSDKAVQGFTQDCSGGECVSRTPAEDAEWARQSGAGDSILFYNVIVSQYSGPAVGGWRIHLPARMVDVETGDLVESWSDHTRDFPDLLAGCTDSCQEQWLASKVAEMARDATVALGKKLASAPRGFVYRATFKDFTQNEVNHLEAALRQSPGYGEGGLKLMKDDGGKSEWLHRRTTRVYEFRTPLGAGAMSQLLESLLEKDGIAPSVKYEGRVIDVERIGTPYLWRYISAFLGLLLLPVLGWVGLDYRRQNVALAGFDEARLPHAGLDHLQRLTQRPLPLLPRWRQLAVHWREQAAALKDALQRAAQAIESADFATAQTELARAQSIDARHPRVQAMLAELPRQQQARGLLDEGRAKLESAPTIAAKALTQALELDASLAPLIRPLLDQARELLRWGLVLNAQQDAERELGAGRAYAALGAAGRGLNAIRGLDGMHHEREALQAWVDKATATIVPLSGPAIGTGLLAGVRILVADGIDIGRGNAASNIGIGVGYKRASRLGRQSRVQRDRSGLTVEDVGSVNGSLLDMQSLTPHKPMRLHQRHELAIGGERESGTAGACRMRITIAHESGRSAWIDLDRGLARIFNRAELTAAWPSLSEDLQQVWLLLADPVAFALGERLSPAQDGEPAVVLLGYEEGYFLMPVNDEETSRVHINGEPLTTRVPLAEGVNVTLDGRSFGLERW